MPGLQNAKSTLDFLGTIGSKDRGDAMPATAKALVGLAAFLIEKASDNLDRKGHVATGNTISSMKAVNLDLTGVNMSVDVEILSTYKFLDQGVKGVNGGSGKYSFKNKFVSKKMMNAILKWVKKRSLSGKTKYKAVSKNERKNKRLNKIVSKANSRESLAYAIAANVKKNGIDRTLFFTNAIKDTQKEVKKRFAAALKIDIINQIN